MIIGFYGKGGSGKSTVATQMAFCMNQLEKKILAIDADHNMDLSYNLTGAASTKDFSYIGNSREEIKKYLGLKEHQKYSDAFIDIPKKKFSLTPKDVFTEKYTNPINNRIDLMISGYKTDKVLHEKACAHSLSAPLKVFLPLLNLQEDEVVIVDEKAGADGVTTGIVSGIDVAVIICEPALHSVKAALQIAELMNFYNTPYLFVGNKVGNKNDEDFIENSLGKKVSTFLPAVKELQQNPSLYNEKIAGELENIHKKFKALNQNNRLKRTIEKYKKNRKM